MKIITATSQHLPALEALAQRCFTETFGHLYSAEDLHHHLTTTCVACYFEEALAQGDKILMAEQNSQFIGYAKFGHIGLPLKSPSPPADREIHRLYVLASHHGAGLGRALMEAMLATPSMAVAPYIYLGVWSENIKAQRFYAHYGFEHCGEYTYYVGNHADNEFILRRELTTQLRSN